MQLPVTKSAHSFHKRKLYKAIFSAVIQELAVKTASSFDLLPTIPKPGNRMPSLAIVINFFLCSRKSLHIIKMSNEYQMSGGSKTDSYSLCARHSLAFSTH